MPIAPEDVKTGHNYRFEYKAHTGSRCVVFGVYKGWSIQHGVYWLHFIVDGEDYPHDLPSIENMTEVTND